jgi:hypothetical protein
MSRWKLMLACAAAAALIPCPAAAELPAPTAIAEAPTTKSADQPVRLVPELIWCDGEWKLRVTGEQRLRYEDRRDFAMNETVHPNSYGIGLMQTRMSFDLVHESLLRLFLEVMDARQIGARDIVFNETSYFNVHQLYVDIGGGGASPVALRLGRQEMTLGSKRLVESSTWGNLPQLFDGARLI